MCMGVSTSVGADRPSRSRPGIAGCSWIPALPLTLRPSNRRVAGPLSDRAPARSSMWGQGRRRLNGRATKARNVQALLTAQRCAMPPRLTRGAAGRSVKDGSIRRRASRRLRVRLSMERQGRCGSRPLTAALGEVAPLQRPACLRSMNTVADTRASQVVDTTRPGVVNPGLDAFESAFTHAKRFGRRGSTPCAPLT